MYVFELPLALIKVYNLFFLSVIELKDLMWNVDWTLTGLPRPETFNISI